MRDFLKDKQGVPAASFLVRHGESQFKGHVKPGRPRGSSTHLHPRKIMNGIAATAELIENIVEAAAPARNLQRRSRQQPECTDAGNVGEEQRLEL
jgi:hypothetical protein